MADLGSILHTPPAAAWTTLQSLQAICAQPESSPWVCPLKPEFQHPATAHTSRRVSSAGKCSKVAQTICAGLSLFCLLQAGCCTLLWVSEAPYLSRLTFQLVKGVPSVREPFPFYSSLPGTQVLSRFLFVFPFVLAGHVVILLAALVVWDLLAAFSVYSAIFMFHMWMHFWCICGKRWAPCPSIPPSWSPPTNAFKQGRVSDLKQIIIER